MEAVRNSLNSRATQPAAAAAATSPVLSLDTPQQRWEATLGVLTATVLGLHARLGLLTVPTTLEEDLVLEAAALAGAFVSWTPQQIAGLSRQQQEGDHQQEQQAHGQALEAVHSRLLDHTMEVAALQTVPYDSSSSSHAKVQQLQAGLADLGAQLDTLTEYRAQAPWRCEQMDKLQQLVQETLSKTGAAEPAAATAAGPGMDACVLLAIQARLQQQMLIHVYGVLCDAIAAELQPTLA
jgi:hypothetical protein